MPSVGDHGQRLPVGYMPHPGDTTAVPGAAHRCYVLALATDSTASFAAVVAPFTIVAEAGGTAPTKPVPL